MVPEANAQLAIVDAAQLEGAEQELVAWLQTPFVQE